MAPPRTAPGFWHLCVDEDSEAERSYRIFPQCSWLCSCGRSLVCSPVSTTT